MEVSVIKILLLAIWAAIAMLEVLTTGVGMWNRPIVAGLGAGIILGDPGLGIVVGSMLEMTALGVWSYGGAAVPDYTTGAVIGVMIGYMTNNVDIGLTSGVAIAALTQNLDVFARTANALWAHRADKAAEEGSVRGFLVSHYLGVIPWSLSRMIPVLIVGFIGQAYALQLVDQLSKYPFIMDGFKAVGAAMPAVGFVILLNYLPFSKMWYWTIVGFVAAAYLNIPILGIALIGLVCAIVYTNLYFNNSDKDNDNMKVVGGEF